jgi:para-nitrobenzyl esterase
MIDTADVYSAWAAGNKGGESETIIGEWLAQRGRSEDVLIATKVGAQGGLSASNIGTRVHACLKRLGVDCIDLLYAHKDDQDTPIEESLEAFERFVQAGKVRTLGASNYSASRLGAATNSNQEARPHRVYIAAFGGDPGNVTIFGQSGGGTAVMSNLVSPLSKGLFHRAINQSGTRIGVTPPAAMLKLGEEFAAAAGCSDQSAECLRALTVQKILDHQAGILRVLPDFPTVDGTVITHKALQAFSNGLLNQVPIMTGLVADEQAYFLAEPNTGVPLTPEEFHRYTASFGAAHTAKLLAKYAPANYPNPSLAEIAMAQGFTACTARLLDRAWAQYVPVYAYEFHDQTAPSYFRPVSYPMRAYHTAELQYLFPQFHGGQGTPHPLNQAQERLADLMVDYWTAFARYGTLDHSSDRPLPSWPRYSAANDNVVYLDLAGLKNVDGYGKTNDCDLWDTILDYQ